MEIVNQRKKSQGYSSVAQGLPGKPEVMSLIPGTEEKRGQALTLTRMAVTQGAVERNSKGVGG